MFSEELNRLIEAALVDGIVTDKERSVILKRAVAEGVDPDEVEMILDARIQETKQDKEHTDITTYSTNLSERLKKRMSQIENKYQNQSDKERRESEMVEEMVSVIELLPFPKSKSELYAFVLLMKRKWLGTYKNMDWDPLKKAYKAKYYEGLSLSMSLYANDYSIKRLYEQEEKDKKKFEWRRLTILQQCGFIIVLLLLFMVVLFTLGSLSERSEKTENVQVYETYQDAARAHDFEAAQKILDKMLDDYHNKEITPYSDSWFSSNKRHYKETREKEEMLEAYKEGVEYVFNSELLYLCSIGDKESIDRISFLLSEVKIEGTPISDGVMVDYDRKRNHKKYISSVSNFNLKCDKIIDLAITNKNVLLAKQIIPIYKPVPGDVDELKSIAHIQYFSEAKEKAVNKVNKAIDEGIFPNVTEHIN